MVIEQGIREFFKKLSINQNIWDDDLDLSYDGDTLNVFIENIKSKITLNEQLTFIFDLFDSFISSGYDLSKAITNYTTFIKAEIKYLKRNKNTKYRVRDFVSVILNGAIIPIKYFSNGNNPYNLSSSDKEDVNKKILELLLYYSNKNQNDFDKLLKLILNQTKNTIITIFNTNINFIDLYSKSYFVYLLKGYSTIYPDNLGYTYNINTTVLNNVLSSNDIFTQFFEIYDVIDEYHHAKDLLIKYLKMYQIIEYLITRTVIVNIQKNQIHKNLFLREISSLSKLDDYDEKKVKELFSNDRNSLINWFKLLLNDVNVKTTVETLLNVSSIDLSNDNQVYNSFLRVIYKLRNAIVHNKESEVHLTIHNLEQTNGIIKLLKEILKKMEHILFSKMANFEETIKYDKPFLDLY